MTNSKLIKKKKRFESSEGVENIVRKGKNAVASIFSYSYNVFKRLLRRIQITQDYIVIGTKLSELHRIF